LNESGGGGEKFKGEDEFHQTQESQRRKAELDEELNPQPKALLKLFLAVRLLAGFSALNMLLAQTASIWFSDIGLIDYIVMLYMIVLSTVVIFNELDWTFFTGGSALLSNWIGRGIVYSFLGVLGVQQESTEGALTLTLLTYLKTASWMMITSGMIYFVLGCLCCQPVSKKMKRDLQHRQEVAKEVKKSLGKRGIV